MTVLRLLVQLRFSFFLILCVIAFESSTVVSSFSIIKSTATRTQPSFRSYTNVVGGGGAVASLSSTSTTTILFAKKKNTSSGTSKQQQQQKQQQVDEIPANLKRKVSAKRDPLGHVIPQNTRSKGGT